MKKRITALVMSVALLFNVVIGVNTETKTINAMEKCSNISLIEQELKEEIPKTAQEFIKKKFPSIKKVVEQSKEELSLEGKDVINVHIDRPFMILTPVNSPRKCIFQLAVIFQMKLNILFL